VSVRFGILAMVAQGPTYGYLLRAEFDRRTGTTWPLNVGQVYKALETLERDGLVAKTDQTDAAGHVFYEITATGRAAVADWLSNAEVSASPSRNDVAIKIAIAATLPGVDVAAVIRTQRQAAIRNLQHLTRASTAAIPLTGEELGRQLVTDAILFDAETEVRWLDHVAARIAAATRAGLSLDVPLDSTPPRRGRPSGSGRTPPKDDTHA